MSDIGYEGKSYKHILDEHDRQHGFGRLHDKYDLPKKKNKVAKKMDKPLLTGKSQKQQMRFTKQNRDYQNKIGRAWND